MTRIVLTDEQLRQVQQANGPVDVCDTQGRSVASLSLLGEQDLQEIDRWKRSRGQPKQLVPSAQVRAHLRRLEEILDAEGLDREKARDLLRRMQAGEQV